MKIERFSRRWGLLAGMFLVAALLSACATQPTIPSPNPPGFWSGMFHGFTIFFSLLASFVTDVRIYAFPNSGEWYDVGYFLGASIFLGGGVAGAGAA